MKIEPTRSVTGSIRGAGIARTGGAGKRPARSGEAAAETTAPRTLSDNVEILGVPEAELTPKVRAALMAEVAELRREVSETRERLANVERMADQDGLVPTVNRRAFVRELSRAIANIERYGAKAAVVYFDINGFKGINDTLGHAAGDAALHHIAGVLLASVRETDTVGRLGGDEFGVILSHSEEHETKEKAEALVKVILRVGGPAGRSGCGLWRLHLPSGRGRGPGPGGGPSHVQAQKGDEKRQLVRIAL